MAPRRAHGLERRRLDLAAARSEALRMGIPPALVIAVRRGDVPTACFALVAHNREGRPLPEYVLTHLRIFLRTGSYDDAIALAQTAREAFVNLDTEAA